MDSNKPDVIGTHAAGDVQARQTLPASAPPMREGYAQVPGGRVWWRTVGDVSRPPILILHGGPGAAHDYLEPLSALSDDYLVVFYDQLGCGRSDKPDVPALWQVDRFVEEIDALRAALGLDRILLYGHSWGGWLAQEYMRSSRGASSVDALVLASTSASIADFTNGAQRLFAEMPGDINVRRLRLEEAGQIETADYKAIVDAFYEAHLVHVDPPPACLLRTLEYLAGSRTYPIMNGPNEFTVTGTLKGWDASASLGGIKVPTLILTGEWDQVTLDCHERLERGIENSRLSVIPGTRHLGMIERPEAYMSAIREFLHARD
jgi:proline iminopeptidase